MSNPNFTIVVDQKVNSQSSQKINSRSVSADTITANSLMTNSFNSNCMNGYKLVQETLYTPKNYASVTNFNGWLYTKSSYSPVAAGTADPNFFVLPINSVVVGISASNLDLSHPFGGTSFSVGYVVYSATPGVPTALLASVLPADVNTPGGVAAGNSIVDMPYSNAALGSAGMVVAPSGFTVSAADTGMNLSVVGTTYALDALVFKISYLVKQD